MDGRCCSVYCSVVSETEPWSYHADGSPVYSLADIIRKRSAITPGLIALTEAGRLTSFAELDQRSSQVARALQRKDVRPGDRVVFIGASGPEFAEVMYGAAKCRAIFTAVNNRLSAREVLAILADAEPRVVIADPAAAPLVADVGTLGFDCDALITDLDYLAWRDYAHAMDPGEPAEPDETALILYTSGTTGAPKGVELTGRNLGCALHELHASIDLDTGSVCAAPVPFFHIAGLGMLLAANLNGGNLLLEQRADIAAVLRLLVDRQVTHAVLVPTVLQRLLALPEARTADWSALSYVVYGASPIPLPVLRDATEIIGCSFLQSYGLTESTGGFTLLGPDDHRPPRRGRGRRGRRPLRHLGRVPLRRRRPAPRRRGVRGRADRLDPRPPGSLQVPGRRRLRLLPGPDRLRQAPETSHPRHLDLDRRPLTQPWLS